MVLQVNERCYQAPLPPVLSEEHEQSGPLAPAACPRLPCYCGPVRHPLVFRPLPRGTGYRAYLAPPISRGDEEGFSSCLARPGHRAVAPTPPEWPVAPASLRRSMRPSPSGCGLGLRGFALSGPPLRSLAVRPGDSLAIPRMALSMGFRILVSRHPTIQATGRLAITPVGLTPTERASLRWTHNRACGLPAHGSPITVSHRHARGKPRLARRPSRHRRNPGAQERGSSLAAIPSEASPSAAG